MTTQITYPKHPTLQKLIQYFLFIRKDDDGSVSQICYPNTNHCFSFTKRSQLIKINHSEYKIARSDQDNNYVTGIYKKPITIYTHIPYEEVCINFNPLALETIFHKKVSSYEFKDNIFENTETLHWEILNEIIFSSNNPEKIQQEIENYFLLLIKDELDIHYVDKINSISSLTSIEEIENLLCKSYRSTHRFFKSNLDTSPKDFVLIKKIRAGIHLLFEENNISEIAYELDFTDTSHFIKTFKKYTNQTPTTFREKASILNDTLVWNLE